jgi:AraC family transcriptional regulator, regulatory protein of adaptative response / DNA-3-methyladenine glycosylase II
MNLDWNLCSKARLARDARFDGKFFIGVLTTRIYCRPICRSRSSKESNVRYFPSAAAAAQAGFRPCLRCRPECSPGSPAWAGTQNTVSRALRLISETGLEEGGLESLAAHLGIGSRHLRRLFLRHLGASPSAVAQTRRLQFAKKLIDETNLPMTEVALASGFGSVRRFNAAIRKTYNRTPTQIRALAGKTPSPADNQYMFHLNFRPPYDWERLLEFLACRAISGIEVIAGDTYRRSICVSGHCGFVEVSREASRNTLSVRVHIGEPRLLFFIIERVRSMFDLDADWPTVSRTLKSDSNLARYISEYPGLRVPGCWDGFELAIRAILSQHARKWSAGRELASRLKEWGEGYSPVPGITHVFPRPQVLADADFDSIGLARQQTKAIHELSRAVHNGQITFDHVLDSEAFLRKIAAVAGISKWTVQWLALCAFREPDAFPSADSDLTCAFGSGTPDELETRSAPWRPWRAYAAIYLWTFAKGIREEASARIH